MAGITTKVKRRFTAITSTSGSAARRKAGGLGRHHHRLRPAVLAVA
jgi:hypothetical protein